MRTIVNHNAQAWADDYLALSNRSMAHASEIETSGTAHPLHWHIHGQLQSIGRLAFDIQACILRAQQPTDKDQDMNSTIQPSMPLDMALKLTFNPAEMTDVLDQALSLVISEVDVAPLNVNLQNAINALRCAIENIDTAEEQLARYTQAGEDKAAVFAIRAAIHHQFAHESNVEGARGMLADVEAFGTGILEAIRAAGYQVTPLG